LVELESELLMIKR